MVQPLVELIKVERAVIVSRGQTEAVFDQTFLAGAVAVVHGAHLWQRDVALVHDQQEVLREVVDQRKRGGTGFAARQHPRIVLDAAAKTDFLQHFNVIPRALADALRFNQLAVLLKILDALFELVLKVADGGLQFTLGGDIVARRKDRRVPQFAQYHTGQGVDTADAVDLVAEKFDAHHVLIRVNRPNLHRVPAHAEAVAFKSDVVALVLNINEPVNERFPADFHTRAQ